MLYTLRVWEWVPGDSFTSLGHTWTAIYNTNEWKSQETKWSHIYTTISEGVKSSWTELYALCNVWEPDECATDYALAQLRHGRHATRISTYVTRTTQLPLWIKEVGKMETPRLYDTVVIFIIKITICITAYCRILNIVRYVNFQQLDDPFLRGATS